MDEIHELKGELLNYSGTLTKYYISLVNVELNLLSIFNARKKITKIELNILKKHAFFLIHKEKVLDRISNFGKHLGNPVAQQLEMQSLFSLHNAVESLFNQTFMYIAGAKTTLNTYTVLLFAFISIMISLVTFFYSYFK